MMDLYERSTYDIQRYIQWPEINFEDEHLVSYALFKQLDEYFVKVKVEVQAKEEFSKEDIQELLIKSLME